LDRKQGRKWEQVLLCIAGLIYILSLGSCAPPKETVKTKTITKTKTVEKEICSHRDFLRTLNNADDFERALKRNQEILSANPKTSPGDEALFNIGLIYAHPENPQKDYKKSMVYFQRLLKEFPRSFLVEEAKMWIGVLQDIEKAMKVDIEIERKRKELSK
jgi:tetratricopeptide (TPR) repeat protein